MSKGMSGHRSGAVVNVRYWPLADMEAHVRSLPAALARCCISGTLRTNGINCVRFDAINFVFCEPTHIVGLHARCCLRTHLVNRPTQPRPKCDGPPVIG